MNYKIALYIRASTEEQSINPEGTIKNQEDRLRGFITQKNSQENFGKTVSVFVDRAKSGKDFNRPELRNLIKAIESGEVNLVLVTELSRLSRSVKDFAGLWDLMREHKCSFMSLRESFDTTNAAGEMMIFSIMNFPNLKESRPQRELRPI